MNSFLEKISGNYSYWVLIAVIIALAAMIGYSISTKEGMEVSAEQAEPSVEPTPEPVAESVPEVSAPVASEDQEFAQTMVGNGESAIRPEDLLPQSDEVRDFSKKFEQNRLNRNFLVAGHHIGVNTVSSSLKNANLSIRSDPVIPRVNVGPWNDSTILASDVINRRKFEIGSAGSD